MSLDGADRCVLLDLPRVVLNVSPDTHPLAMPAVELTWLPLVVLTAVGVSLVGLGVAWFRRRDLEL